LVARGYRHGSPMTRRPTRRVWGVVCEDASERELARRCSACRSRQRLRKGN
jgi:hypothetical protein